MKDLKMKTENAFDKAYENWIRSNDPFLMEAKDKPKDKPKDKDDPTKKDGDDDKTKKESTIKKLIAQAAKNYAKERTGAWLNELFLGNFKDACIDVLKKELKTKLNDEKEIDKIAKNLEESPDYKRAKDYKELDNRKDSETSADIDKDSAKIFAIWYSKEKEENVGKLISGLVADIQKAGKKLDEDVKKLKEELKKQKIEISDEDIQKFGPALMQLVNNKATADEIKSTLKKLKSEVKESMAKKIGLKNTKFLNESLRYITEDQKQQYMLEFVFENKLMTDAIASRLVAEGIFSNMKAKLKAKMSDLGSKLKTATMSGLQKLSKSAFGPMLSLVGLGAGILTGGLAAELIVKAMYIIERRGKYLKNAFERSYAKYANAKGILTKMDFTIDGDKKKKYSMRFYDKDKVWRVINVADQLKRPDKDRIKAMLQSDVGKKYREFLQKVWDPLFEESKGGKIDFEQLFTQAKDVQIPEKALKLFKQFAESYDEIKANCIESPKIDTRVQSTKKNEEN